jgi:hypothetical protein
VNLNTLKVEKREEFCFVEEEEAIVLVSITRAPLKPYTRHPPLLFHSELKYIPLLLPPSLSIPPIT